MGCLQASQRTKLHGVAREEVAREKEDWRPNTPGGTTAQTLCFADCASLIWSADMGWKLGERAAQLRSHFHGAEAVDTNEFGMAMNKGRAQGEGQ